MKKIPFYPNTADTHDPMVAIFQTLFEYFLNKKMTAEAMKNYMGFKPGVSGRIINPLVAMARQGFDIKMIEPFNYAKFAEQGEEYLEKLYGHAEAFWLTEHTNILDTRNIAEFIREIRPIGSQALLQDIDSMLDENRLVIVTVNGKALNNKPGKASHAVLVLQRHAEDYIVHDPGEPALPYRTLSRVQLWEAMGGEEQTAQVTGIIYRNASNHRRLDLYVVTQKPRLSRAFAAKLIEQGKVLVNGIARKPGYKVQDTDVVTIDYDDRELDAIPDIDLPVIYEDDDCIVINKPAGILTHTQGKFNPEATVATFLRHRSIDLEGERAGVVHRLDRATSGILIGAKHPVALQKLQEQFAARTAKKVYLAIVAGHPKQDAAVIDMPIERNPKLPATFRVGPNGKSAVTKYRVIKQTDTASLVELKPQTGRTHQLRVHMAQLGTPIVGDPLYGTGEHGDRLYLHAHQLTITLPNGASTTFTAPVPSEFEEYLAHA